VADAVALQGFVDTWLRRSPEMALCEVFVPPGERPMFRAWGALRMQLLDTTFEFEERSVARTKLAWWGQDLISGSNGRHPLTRALYAHPASASISGRDWQALLSAAIMLLDSDHAPATLSEALAELQPLARALAAVQSQLLQETHATFKPSPRRTPGPILILGAASKMDPGVRRDDESRFDGLALHLQFERNLRGLTGVHRERARLPTALGSAPTPSQLADYAGALLATPTLPGMGLLAAYQQRLDTARLQRWARHGDPARAVRLSHPHCLWLAWRAARAARA